MTNGIASIVIVKKTGRLNSVSYTYNYDAVNAAGISPERTVKVVAP